MLELIGTLVYIQTDKWEEAIADTEFIHFLCVVLGSEYSEDDILLECIMLIATIVRTEKISEIVAQSYLI